MNSILAVDMNPSFAFIDPNESRRLFLETGGPAFQNLIDSLIIHDEVVIPTGDFLVVNILAMIIGEVNLRRCIESRILRFVKIKGLLGYAGSGNNVHGLCSIKTGISPGKGLYPVPTKSNSVTKDPYSAPTEDALIWAFTGLKASSETPFLKAEIMASTIELKIDDLLQSTKADTDLDLSQSVLYEKFESEDVAKGLLNGLAPNEVRLYQSPYVKNSCDDVDLVLHTANTNIEIAIAENLNCTSCSTSSPILSILQAKEQEFRVNKDHKKFYELTEVASIPCLARGIVEKNIEFEKILNMRSSKAAEEFRSWFHTLEDDANIGKEYINLLREGVTVDSLPVRVLRFITTSVIGSVEPISGLVVGAADSFLVSQVFSKHQVKYFVEKLHELGDFKN